MKNHYVHDYETLRNCFVAVFEHYKENVVHEFVVHELRNDFDRLVAFLENNVRHNEWHISFNGLAFDSQITQYILDNKRKLKNFKAEEIAMCLYKHGQDTIERTNAGMFPEIPEWDLHIRQIDLYKMHNWDSPKKQSSLKWIQYTMDWSDVREMPIHHTTVVHRMEQIEEILSYCRNDVGATKEIYHRSQGQVLLRKELTAEYGINLFSASEPRISKELFAHLYCSKTGMDKKKLKQLRSPREKLVLSDLILPCVAFQTPEFQKVHDYFRNQVFAPGKDTLSFTLDYKGIQTTYGQGGIHGARNSGIYRAGNGMAIMTLDAESFYANLAIENGWSPAHLEAEPFCETYKWFFTERKQIPKTDARNGVYKNLLTAIYGMARDKDSFLYDPEFAMRIVVNGQLLLSMLYERLTESIPGAVPLMQNTDGLEMMIPEQYRDRYMEICAEWEAMTRLHLEHSEYSKLVLASMSDYIGVRRDGKIKCKGRFDFEDLALHKDKSFLVVPKALYQYFIHGVKPEDYIENNQNIYDYCAGAKVRGASHFEETRMTSEGQVTKKLQKIVRYYNSTNGAKLVKVSNDNGKRTQLESGKWLQTTFNRFEERSWEDYDVNTEYYLQQIYREINNVDRKVTRTYSQLELFA